jgi:HD-like signal output (HDOD) protein/CheY-like chemotaxis protein
MRPKIIFVDDERPILRALKRVLFNEPYDCLYFDSGYDALEEIQENGPADLIMTDMRMPLMGGLELLDKVRADYPEMIRVVLSGYTDHKVIMDALEGSLSHFYIHKPWGNNEIITVIEHLLEMKWVMNSEEMKLRMDELGELPTLPRLYVEISSMIHDEASVDDIVKKIEEDFVVAGNILKVANKAYYGHNVATVKQAVMVLGLSNVKQIVIATSVFKDDSKRISGLHLWKHAFLTNMIVSYIYEHKYGGKMPLNTGSVGLMHSIGVILLLNKYPKEYEQVISLKEANSNRDLCDIENEILGVDHTKVGGFFLNWWELRLANIEVAMNYRMLDKNEALNNEVVMMVHVASYVAWKVIGNDIFAYPLNLEATKICNYSSEQVEGLIDLFKNDLN